MRQYVVGVCFMFMWVLHDVKAQQASRVTIPGSPAFGILNFEPSAVMRPTNARDLAADILNSFDEEGKLLLNLGLEVAPYWLKSNPGLTREAYLRPSTKQTIMQTFSLSAATVKDSITGANKLGAGFRFRLINGEPVAELETANAELDTRTMVVAIIQGVRSVVAPRGINTKELALQAIENALRRKNVAAALINSVRNDAQQIEGNYSDSVSDIQQMLDVLLNRRVEAYSELAAKVSDLIYQRRGLLVEFAGATGFSTTKNTRLEKVGIWGNASYFVSADDLFTLTARYMDQNVDTAISNLDVGLGFLKKTARYNISVEGMARWYRAEVPDFNSSNQPIIRLEKEFTYRLAVQGSLMISRDVSVNLNFGKDFNTPFISGSGFFSILGFNYSIFNKKPLELK